MSCGLCSAFILSRAFSFSLFFSLALSPLLPPPSPYLCRALSLARAYAKKLVHTLVYILTSEQIQAAAAKRYVGTPGMNSICRAMLEGVETIYETRAVAKRRSGGTGWSLEHGKSGEKLGDFDFLICTDKTAAMRYRNDLDKKALTGYVKPASGVRSASSLALMLATKETNLTFSSLLLENHAVFSWIARDDSKPGRQRIDGIECWVAHASPAFTQRFLDSQKGGYANAIRTNVVRDMQPHFEALVSDLGGVGANVGTVAQGHRWGAAFPTSSFDPSTAEPFYLDSDLAFAACGDYFTPFPGRVEGGWMSGSSLADALLEMPIMERRRRLWQ